MIQRIIEDGVFPRLLFESLLEGKAVRFSLDKEVPLDGLTGQKHLPVRILKLEPVERNKEGIATEWLIEGETATAPKRKFAAWYRGTAPYHGRLALAEKPKEQPDLILARILKDVASRTR